MKYRRASLKRVKTQNQPHIPKIVKKKDIFYIVCMLHYAYRQLYDDNYNIYEYRL